MKKLFEFKTFFANIIALMLNQVSGYSQNQWDATTVAGNLLNTPPRNNIFGTAGLPNPSGKRDIRFFTFGVERMRLIGEIGTNQGFLGVNTINPNQRIHIGQGSLGVEDGFGIVGTTYFPGQLDMVQFQNARINMIVRNKTLGIFCENFGATPDDVKLGDATDVNTTIYAQDFAPSVQKGLFLRGSNGNFRMGHFMIPFAFPNIEMDVISTASAQMGSTNPNIFDIVFQGRIHDDTLSNIRLMNGTNADNTFVPMLAGFNNRNYFTNATQGMVVSGAIRVSSDIAGLFNTAVVEFDARKRNANGLGGTAVINRDLFQWCNFTTLEMLMDANGQLGLRTATPDNRLEITTITGDPFFGSANGSSGLRLTNMKGGSGPGFAIPVANPGPGVLTVNNDGDVIYVPSGGNFGNVCGTTAVPLTTDWEIPLATFAYNFSGDGAVNISRFTNCASTSKFFVEDDVYSVTSVVQNNTMIPGNIAGEFIGSDAAKVHAIVVPPGGGNAGLGVLSPNPGYRLVVNGNYFLNGNFDGVGIMTYPSDPQFKTNIDSISNALDIIGQLNPKSFYFDTTNVYGLNFSNKKQYGLIAPEVELILPELVSNMNKTEERDTLGNIISGSVSYKTLNYNAFIAILMQGIKEQQKSIDSLKSKTSNQDSINTSLQDQINQLATLINSCCSSHTMQQSNNSNNPIVSQDVNLKDSQIIILDQNSPNPFSEQTTINYDLPENVVKAQMLFYNVQGKLIQSVDLFHKGKGSLNVFAQDLSNGIYTYTLVVDGKVFETKKMVKQ